MSRTKKGTKPPGWELNNPKGRGYVPANKANKKRTHRANRRLAHEAAKEKG
jgi:hypothetical protein